jgi:cell pole-organizing protein PopZ
LEQGGFMSAINSNSSDGDLEAIHRAQRAHEPSMEEILASIRNIIADDPAKEGAPKRQQAPAPTPQIVYSKDAPRSYGDASGLSQRPDANAPTVVWRRPQAVEAEPAANADVVQHSSEPLLSPEANEAVALSFGALSANLDVRSAELADSMVRDMLRPMVKTWLDDNLPTLVERLVREEIQRVARGRK